ncbi:longitudinals lacking protein, isoforms H/M/V isoform X1 [Frankliniella occidentalis]|uniref:Longitudinals lacking protein, isoforms H/M/V isoform X1 n=1 Tax=Frankliniella occidentalis TaxID=133901 RepID=A0A9C6U3X2_FRAOC|nr:longitudinals lacking protein, isoforms H/M/V isoform X1 [Frankliniella occidentalis]
MADQQYCLRWNNHQTTLISVFESLQERGCMVDCTLAAEGQSLQAHKVVLSACSPYLEDLLSKHYDKHPILLLKDVKFEELKAMMDYMYRGEVNVAQDKLNTFLRAAESLQIKGLSDGGTDPPDSGGTGSMKRTAKGAPVSVRSNQQLTVRTTNLADDNSSRDGSVSPSLRKRRRRRGSDGSDHDNSSNVADGKQSSAAAAPVTGPTVNNEDMLPTVPASGPSDDNLLSSILESTETENATDSGITSANNTVPLQENVIRDRDNVLIEPKTEYLDDDAQDLHLDDDDSMFRAGPSHARGSGNYEGDDGEDVYMANQDSGANAQGDLDDEELSGGLDADVLVVLGAHHLAAAATDDLADLAADESGDGGFQCADCGKRFRAERTLSRHRRVHNQFRPHKCVTCGSCFTNKSHLTQHIRTHTGEKPFPCAQCGSRFTAKSHLAAHERRHSGERPFQCPVPGCGARFVESSHLHAHVRRHGGERCYKCPAAACGARFIRRSDLARHRLSHAAERPFQCGHPGCEKSFARATSLRKHERRQHGVEGGDSEPDGPDGSEEDELSESAGSAGRRGPGRRGAAPVHGLRPLLPGAPHARAAPAHAQR